MTKIALEGFGEMLASLESYEKQNGADNTRSIELFCKYLKIAMKTELNEKQNDIMNKYYFQHMKLREIADIYGVNVSTISRYLKRSRNKIRRAMQFTVRGLSDIQTDFYA